MPLMKLTLTTSAQRIRILFVCPLSAFPGIQLYLKDESTHPTGSLKHRLARSLFLYGLCNGWIKEGTPIIEASSGSTAISEAWFAPFIGTAVHRRHARLYRKT
ncbi:lyase [Salmonella enterica subsp. arizonae]|uniref:Lyase n=1 Tax=Salmonella enterica subsp. arizonae TaxID=59203 RepID=A0A379SAJ4_SALER|nr:lyase [Salmonella enterica subsp. arizonae]